MCVHLRAGVCVRAHVISSPYQRCGRISRRWLPQSSLRRNPQAQPEGFLYWFPRPALSPAAAQRPRSALRPATRAQAPGSCGSLQRCLLGRGWGPRGSSAAKRSRSREALRRYGLSLSEVAAFMDSEEGRRWAFEAPQA
jgi:hypothetical protein